MKKENFIIFTVAIAVFTISALFFLKFNNDHVECGQTITYNTNSKGEKIKTVKHICKEKFNF